MLKLSESFMFQGSGGRVIQNTTTEAILMILIAARTKLLQSSTLTVLTSLSFMVPTKHIPHSLKFLR
ncbi:hypothetical protein GQ457_06G009110 [Hibiscus cannabinus]